MRYIVPWANTARMSAPHHCPHTVKSCLAITAAWQRTQMHIEMQRNGRWNMCVLIAASRLINRWKNFTFVYLLAPSQNSLRNASVKRDMFVRPHAIARVLPEDFHGFSYLKFLIKSVDTRRCWWKSDKITDTLYEDIRNLIICRHYWSL